MGDYFENLNGFIKQYFNILSDEIPDFLPKYINTPELQKQDKISVSCGSYYTKLFNTKLWYSSLNHSVAVALIIWHFTKDKKQTLAGLFHDIATPVFKHCIDFMNGDYEKQESTEELTFKALRDSKEITELLKKDKIKLDEVSNYHIYKIADNDTPKLSADRLEYTLSNGLGVRKSILSLEDVRNIYKNIKVLKNEEGEDELGFVNQEVAEKFVNVAVELQTQEYVSNAMKLSMQFLADIMKELSKQNFISKDDLYNLSENEVINIIKNCKDKNISSSFEKWENTTKIGESEEIVPNKYCRSINGKLRYIVPLVEKDNKIIRIDKISEKAKQNINYCINYRTKKYAYFDFNNI